MPPMTNSKIWKSFRQRWAQQWALPFSTSLTFEYIVAYLENGFIFKDDIDAAQLKKGYIPFTTQKKEIKRVFSLLTHSLTDKVQT